MTIHCIGAKEIADSNQMKQMQTCVAIQDNSIPPHHFQVIPFGQAQKAQASPQSLHFPTTNFASHCKKYDPSAAFMFPLLVHG